ncbi:MAG TPA: hypothetical protein VIF57_18900 [Polyangia bacterium]|jgi:hypothetical protein
MLRVAGMVGFAAVIAAAACSGGSATGPDGGGGGGSGGGAGGAGSGGSAGHVSWSDDGTAVTAIVGTASLVLYQGREDLEVVGATSLLDITIRVEDNPPLLPKTFMCNQPAGSPSATVAYTDLNGSPPGPSPECTVTVTQVGTSTTPAIGTFAAKFRLPSGETRDITDGSFEVQLAGATN